MKNLKVFPKMFLQVFSVVGGMIIFIHLLVYLIFPRTYLESRMATMVTKANDLAQALEGQELSVVKQSLELYSKGNDIKAFIKADHDQDVVEIKNNLPVDPTSQTHSLIIEERDIHLQDGKTLALQLVSTADMKKDAKDLSLKFLPYSLSLSFLFSILISYVYAKVINKNIQEIRRVTDQMMQLDKTAVLSIRSFDEVGELKQQINTLYQTLLTSIGDLEVKNKEILNLEKLKYDFLKGASHELKTPLASLTIILENMKYNIGKYQDRDRYLDDCLVLTDQLAKSIGQILSVSSIDHLKDDEQVLVIKDVLKNVLDTYAVLVSQKQVSIHENLNQETMVIGKSALTIILSNLISNAIKYSPSSSPILVAVKDGWLVVDNLFQKIDSHDQGNDIHYNRHGLGLYIVRNLLDRYHFIYQAYQEEGHFVFKIKLDKE